MGTHSTSTSTSDTLLSSVGIYIEKYVATIFIQQDFLTYILEEENNEEGFSHFYKLLC